MNYSEMLYKTVSKKEWDKVRELLKTLQSADEPDNLSPDHGGRNALYFALIDGEFSIASRLTNWGCVWIALCKTVQNRIPEIILLQGFRFCSFCHMKVLMAATISSRKNDLLGIVAGWGYFVKRNLFLSKHRRKSLGVLSRCCRRVS